MKTLKEYIAEASVLDIEGTLKDGDSAAKEIASFGAQYELVGWRDSNKRKSSCISVPRLKKLTVNASRKSFNRHHHFYSEYAAYLALWLENLDMVELGYFDKNLEDRSNWEDFGKTLSKLMIDNKLTKNLKEPVKVMWLDPHGFRVRFAVSADTFPFYFDLEYQKRNQ